MEYRATIALTGLASSWSPEHDRLTAALEATRADAAFSRSGGRWEVTASGEYPDEALAAVGLAGTTSRALEAVALPDVEPMVLEVQAVGTDRG